jgi:hypothetical protein
MQETSSGGVRVHLDRFCMRCGRYEVRAELPPPPVQPGREREQWMEAQRRKAQALRGTLKPEVWVCQRCGCEDAKPAGEKATLAASPAR